MRLAMIGMLVFLVISVQQASSQSAGATQRADSARSPVILLPGYKLQTVKGIDTFGAVIWKEHGAEIQFSQGAHLEDPMESVKESQVLWKQEQVVSGKKVQCIYTKSHQLIVNFPELHALFFATIHNSQELTEMLLMTVTYDIHEYPVDPSSLGQLRKPKK